MTNQLEFAGLNPLKKAIAAALANVEGVENVQWYNAQYEDERLIAGQGVLVEFPEPVDFDPVTKSLRLADVQIRLHLYTQVIGDADGYISDTLTDAHEATALQIRDLLNNVSLKKDDGEAISGIMQHSGWQHWHRQRKWLVTWITFTTRVRR